MIWHRKYHKIPENIFNGYENIILASNHEFSSSPHQTALTGNSDNSHLEIPLKLSSIHTHTHMHTQIHFLTYILSHIFTHTFSFTHTTLIDFGWSVASSSFGFFTFVSLDFLLTPGVLRLTDSKYHDPILPYESYVIQTPRHQLSFSH